MAVLNGNGVRRGVVWFFGVLGVLAAAGAASAGDIVGLAADATGSVLPAAQVTARNLATGEEQFAQADLEGKFRLSGVEAGTYLVTVESPGFSRDSRTVEVGEQGTPVEVRFTLVPGRVEMGVTVTAARSERDSALVPLRTDTFGRDALASKSPLSVGDALLQAPGITPVGSGPMQVRPRLRGLDSTRVLVLVDGERLNHARTATDRSGTEVGLIDLNTVASLEVASGAGSVLYGTDALSGTINILTHQPRFSDALRFTYGFDGYFSSNENGRRGAATFGATGRRFAFQVTAGGESYDNYRAGAAGQQEDTSAFFTSGRIVNADTIDDNFGFNFNAFPDPFNAPYARTSNVVPTSGASGRSLNASALVALSGTQTLQVKYIRREMDNVGFPDFEPPVFFSRTTLPYNDLDRVSARYEARAITPWFTNLKVTGYFQDQRRLLRTEFPVQFPVPSPAFFPINVYRLNLTTDTEQHVQTPGLDVQASFVPARGHLLTAGMMLYRDGSQDGRTNTSQTTIIGNVAMGARGPAATVFAAPTVLGPPSVTNPVRVPDSSFSDIGVFAQDEWSVTAALRLVAGVRVDGYRVTTQATPGYSVDALVAGAKPPIDAAVLPDVNGSTLSRTAFTGDVGAVYRLTDTLNARARYGRSYRHPNLEELLYSGPATVGAIVPNMQVEPEVGHNIDVGLTARAGRMAGSVSYFHNVYNGFISTEIVATTPSGPVSQAVNFTDVRIQGVEGDLDVPVVTRAGIVTFFVNAALTRGTVLSGENPLTGASLAGTPQDNISPLKAIAGVRFTDSRDRWWVEYGVRSQADVTRVAETLLESPYLIPQDLLSLEGFTLQRVSWGLTFRPGASRLGLVFAVENLTDRYYREQFQFAPARGRTFTAAFSVR
jgi:hemoglobin/transferrin/lactoferrin receptor protein